MSAWSKLAWSPIFCRRSHRITAGPNERHRAKLATVATAAWNVSSLKTRRNPSPWRPSHPDRSRGTDDQVNHGEPHGNAER